MVMITGSIATVGAGLVALGAGLGIGWIGSSAMTAMSRQPELAQKIQVSMLIAAALVEGVALFCAVICLVGAK
jgi:F-type H+-transporting ATPase subunit c